MTPVLLYALGVAVFLVGLLVSIALHEWGHLWVAQRFGCRVSRFMIGFGPTVWSRKVGHASPEGAQTEYGLKALPLGGYVVIDGMTPPRSDADAEAGTAAEVMASTSPTIVAPSRSMLTATPAAAFPARTTRPFYQLTIVGKVLVMVAGPLTNVALAFVCFLGVNLLYGVHETVPTGRAVVASVAGCVIPDGARRLACASTDPVSPAEAAGLQVGDQIVRFNSHEITSWAQLTALVHANGDRRFVMEVARPDPQDPAEQDLGGGHHPSDRAERTLRASTVLVAKKDGADAGNGAAQGAEPMVGFLGVSPESTTTVTRHGPVYTLRQMSTMVTQTASALVGLPGHVANVALAVAGLAERNPDGPMSILGGSRLAGEIAATEVPGFDAASKAALLVMVLGSFNLFIGVVNLVPLLPLDGGHVVGALWEQLRRRIAQLLRRPDPGYVDTSRWVVVTYSVGLALVVMGFVLVVGDLFVPISSGL